MLSMAPTTNTYHLSPGTRRLLACALMVLALATLPAVTPRMPINEVEAGMQGVGITVFEGSRREEFTVHILGVLTNVMGPRRNLIVARLEGGPLAETGVIQGMSGSPVYIDDRLVGAVSYSLGSFSKEAIAGITPIDEMAATDAAPVRTAQRRSSLIQFAATGSQLTDIVRQTFVRLQPFAERPVDIHTAGIPTAEAGRLGTLLRPIATPLTLSGFVPEIHKLWSTVFDQAGFVTTIGGATRRAATQSTKTATLEPGDPVGATLMRGDFTMAGTGTVTFVEDNRVYAFGHPFYNLGRVKFPMTRAHVTTLLPSVAISSRIATIGEVLGTIDQDRSTGIYGTLGPGPSLIPVTVSLSAEDRSLDERFEFEIIDDSLFTPLLTYTGVLNTFFSWTREVGASTYEVSSVARLRGNDDVGFRNVFTGDTAGISAALSTAAPLTILLSNVFEPIELERIDITITSYEEPRVATLQRVWIDAHRPRAGETVPVKIASRTAAGDDVLNTVEISLPRHITGPVQLLVADATVLLQREAQAGRQPQQARSLPQLIRSLNSTRQNDRLYVQLLSEQAGAVVRGAPLTALPPSVLAVLEGDRESGEVVRLQQATLGEWEIKTDHVVSGSRLLTLTIEAG